MIEWGSSNHRFRPFFLALLLLGFLAINSGRCFGGERSPGLSDEAISKMIGEIRGALGKRGAMVTELKVSPDILEPGFRRIPLFWSIIASGSRVFEVLRELGGPSSSGDRIRIMSFTISHRGSDRSGFPETSVELGAEIRVGSVPVNLVGNGDVLQFLDSLESRAGFVPPVASPTASSEAAVSTGSEWLARVRVEENGSFRILGFGKTFSGTIRVAGDLSRAPGLSEVFLGEIDVQKSGQRRWYKFDLLGHFGGRATPSFQGESPPVHSGPPEGRVIEFVGELARLLATDGVELLSTRCGIPETVHLGVEVPVELSLSLGVEKAGLFIENFPARSTDGTRVRLETVSFSLASDPGTDGRFPLICHLSSRLVFRAGPGTGPEGINPRRIIDLLREVSPCWSADGAKVDEGKCLARFSGLLVRRDHRIEASGVSRDVESVTKLGRRLEEMGIISDFEVSGKEGISGKTTRVFRFVFSARLRHGSLRE